MSLVSYAYSDSEDDTVNDCEESSSSNIQLLTKEVRINESENATSKQIKLISSTDSTTIEDCGSAGPESMPIQLSRSSFNLPQPKSDETSGLLISASSTLKNAVHHTKGNKIRISLPSFKNQAEDEIETGDAQETDEIRKRRFASVSGCGLTSLLPPPKKKTTLSDEGRSTSFVPHTLRSRPSSSTSVPILYQRKSAAQKSNEYQQNNVEPDPENDSFFNFEKPATYVPPNASMDISIQSTQPVATDPDHLDFSVRPTQADVDETEQQEAHAKLDEQSRLRHLIERKFGDHVDQDLKIVDVDMSQHMNHNIDYIKSISEERDSGAAGPMPSSQAKRKHQITYLAYQAKQNEIKLKNEWAKNRATKSQAKSRYGF